VTSVTSSRIIISHGLIAAPPSHHLLIKAAEVGSIGNGPVGGAVGGGRLSSNGAPFLPRMRPVDALLPRNRSLPARPSPPTPNPALLDITARGGLSLFCERKGVGSVEMGILGGLRRVEFGPGLRRPARRGDVVLLLMLKEGDEGDIVVCEERERRANARDSGSMETRRGSG